MRQATIRRTVKPFNGLNPLQIAPSILHTWLCSDNGLYKDAGINPSYADADIIGQWNDLTGNGHNVSQATLANKPTLKLNILNGLPVVRFNGTSNFLSSGTFSSALTSSTVILVANIRSTPIAFGCLFDGTVSSNRNAIQCTSSPNYRTYAGSPGPTFSLAVGSWSIINAVFSGASSAVHVNGGSDTTGSAGTQTLTGIALGCEYNGATYYTQVDFAEVMVFSGVLSPSVRSLIDVYLDTRYAIY